MQLKYCFLKYCLGPKGFKSIRWTLTNWLSWDKSLQNICDPRSIWIMKIPGIINLIAFLILYWLWFSWLLTLQCRNHDTSNKNFLFINIYIFIYVYMYIFIHASSINFMSLTSQVEICFTSGQYMCYNFLNFKTNIALTL